MRLMPLLLTFLLIGATHSSIFADAITDHPNGAELTKIFSAAPAGDFKSTSISRADYLKLIAANIDFFKKHQNDAGAIIDPYSKGERQYSTPAFAAAAGLLVSQGNRKDLLKPATNAMTCALTALVENRAADKHADFYIPMLVHAYRFLKDVVPAEQSRKWVELFKKIEPEKVYRADLRKMNWNIVSSSGELLRRHDGLVFDSQKKPQWDYLENCLEGHLELLTPVGLFHDPGAPIIYDAFSRLWLEDVFADDAYDGRHADRIRSFLTTGGLSTLLLLSPTGEWPPGGRSGLHNWGEAEIAAICEINAARWKKLGRNDVAGAFKRAAHLAFQSMTRWQRPTGELWIIKNRAEPETRFAYEGYSNHSQYNLLPMAMLAIAFSRADESIAERPSPSEVGGYVFDARDIFHKVAAAAGGYYVLIDTMADSHYNATGLQRVHRTGVAFSSLSDSAASDRAFGPGHLPKAAMSPGIAWQSGKETRSLADFSGKKEGNRVTSVELARGSIGAKEVSFELTYQLAEQSSTERTVSEKYELTSSGVLLTSKLIGNADAFKVQLPVLVTDGARELDATVSADSVTIVQNGSETRITIPPEMLSDSLKLVEPRVVSHNGLMQKAIATVRSGTVAIRIQLSQK